MFKIWKKKQKPIYTIIIPNFAGCKEARFIGMNLCTDENRMAFSTTEGFMRINTNKVG